MKKISKLLVLALAAIMVLAMSVSVFATSITIESGATGDQQDLTSYNYYEIFKADIKTDATVNANNGEMTAEGVAAYYIPSPAGDTLAGLVDATSVFKTTKSGDGSRWIVELEGTPNGEQIAAALNTDAIKAAALSNDNFAQTSAGGTATSGAVDPGYYLVTSSLGTKLVVQTLSDVTIKEKNDYPSVTKTINEGGESAQIGDDVTYTITVTLPASADKEVVVTDTLSEGLTYKSATVNGGVAGTVANNGQVTTITFTAATVAANAGQTVKITFVATLNSNAVVQGTDANTNTVELDYNNQYTTKETSVGTDTQKITLTKYDGADESKKPIAGAVFELRANGVAVKMTGSGTTFTVDPNGTVTQITTVADTPITVNGVDADVTYTWVEITPPTGYNGLADGVDVTPSTTEVKDTAIANNAGATLPSTGGIGTTIFYIVGAVLVIGAAIMMVTRRRMNNN